MSFGNQLEAFRIKVNRINDAVIIASLQNLFVDIILDTPVLTGYLRSGWYVTFSVPSTAIPTGLGRDSVDRVVTRLANLNTFEADTVYFTNNIAYGPTIEYDGYSRKAPQGMVRINTARWQEIVEMNARTIRAAERPIGIAA